MTLKIIMIMLCVVYGKMKTRKAKKEDSEVLGKLFSILYKPELKWSEGKIKEKILKREKEYYLLIKEDLIVGALGLKFNNQVCKLGPIVIIKKFQKKGFGSKLIEFAEKLSKQKKCKKIWCYSLERYKVGDFYKENHWKQEKFIKNFWNNQNCYIYSKKIK